MLSLPAFPDAALCGSLAGAVAAAVTTPLDVAKTRIMLSESDSSVALKQDNSILGTLFRVYRNEGSTALFKGTTPRVLWIGFGGAVFLGVYEFAMNMLQRVEHLDEPIYR